MPVVYSLARLTRVLAVTSLTHVGAGATSAALRDRLETDGVMTAPEFDRCFAAARLTPGTNLIALFAAIGYRVAGPMGAVTAASLGVLPAAVLSVLVCAAYLQVSAAPGVAKVIEGATAAALAVLIWAALKFIWPYVRKDAWLATTMTGAAVLLHQLGIPAAIVILAAAGLGAIWLAEPGP